MVKFYKPGRVVVVLNGRHAGKKGIIIKSNYENTKEKKFPHCLVVGIAKAPRRVTKRFLKRVEDNTRNLEKKISEKRDVEKSTERINRLKRLGVFIKSFNMSHLLATRYKIDENFGTESSIQLLDTQEEVIKEKQHTINKKEHEKDNKEAKNEIETMKKELGGLKDNYKKTIRDVKVNIGTELFNRFMKGFVKTSNADENEKTTHTEFLFKKLKF